VGPRRILPAEQGQVAETQVCRFLQGQGLELVDRNYRCRHGEIDLIMRDGRGLMFVEVRYRSNRRYADGAETVDYRKQSKLVATALHYLQSHPARFDVIAIAADGGEDRLHWIPTAFGVD
jgi:putative endonuclease